MPVVITAYVEPLQDRPMAVPGAEPVRYRAVAPDAAFPVIDIATCDSDAAGEALLAAQRGLGVAVRAGRYEVEHHREQPAESFDTAGPEDEVTFVNCFAIDAGREDEARRVWQEFNDYFVRKPGYRAHTLHRSIGEDSAFGLVNVVRWESVEAWRAAHDEGFRALVARPLPFVSLPSVCRPVSAQTTVGAGS